MNDLKNTIKIMAPVGSDESLMAAIQAGADAIYFGIGQLNMRSLSTVNFTTKDLARITKLCQKKNIKTYLTLNTVVYDQEIKEMQKVVDATKKNNITAIIASDMATINYALSKDVKVHMSTQVNISNIEAIKYYSQFADVMVLARELTLEQVAEIVKQIKKQKIKGPSGELIKIEIFVHGALCMAISGKCYLSLHHYNSSANRGKCLQLCRRAYEVTDLETGNKLKVDNQYIMSPQDLCTIHFINKILAAGVSVLKIEGRARPAEYVKTVTECYRQAVDSYFDKTYDTKKIKEWQKRLKSVFNRDFWGGYYLGQKLGEWSSVYGSRATRKKIYLGKGVKYFTNLKVGEFKIENDSLLVGDDILITGPTTGVIETKVSEIQFDGKDTKLAKPGQAISIPLNQKIRRSDKLYKYIKVK
ncbi:MAG: collagenase-like protease [Candidatus Komeilibacteria bacterium CG_4_9_14_0_8_um_filter_36_9]|uniref:Collagenase-like protease n=1 Tax=Candidatus Komeilibacteria bacterium CG_4_9_14_0_8_um_filter_36_9 TaxID=1974473 RepID=A0A2M8DQH8_9BACT|nr:MAG: collagenase-like protease [Candidatus Komeilibacteria bacterium CG_4_9_14_0_8_um_filter_36_9]